MITSSGEVLRNKYIESSLVNKKIKRIIQLLENGSKNNIRNKNHLKGTMLIPSWE